MAKKPTKKMMALNLEDIVNAGDEGLHVPVKTAESFYDEGLIEVDENAVDEYGCILVRATQKGYDYYNETQDITGEMSMTTEFVIETGIELPKTVRKDVTSKYPFADLPEPAGDELSSFLVPGDDPKLIGRINNAVTKANNRFSEPTAENKLNRKGEPVPVRRAIRKFKACAVEGGVRVFRIL